MIYTIGHEESYLRAVDEGPIVKNGKATIQEQKEKWEHPLGFDYPGGYAFRTYEDAKKRINEAYPNRGFCVFGLNADWETDTYSSGEWWNNLLNDVEIVVL